MVGISNKKVHELESPFFFLEPLPYYAMAVRAEPPKFNIEFPVPRQNGVDTHLPRPW